MKASMLRKGFVSLEGDSADLLRVLESQSNPCSEIVLVGHSYGTVVVLRALASEPLGKEYGEVIDRVKGMVLISPPSPYLGEVPEEFKDFLGVGWFLGNLSESSLSNGRLKESCVGSYYCPISTHCEPHVEGLRRVLSTGKERKANQHRLLLLKDLLGDVKALRDLETEIRAVKKPALILCGAQDTIIPCDSSREVAGFLGAPVVEIQRSRHSPHRERPDIVAGEILGFLKSL